MIETGWLPDPEIWHLWPETLALLETAASRGRCAAWVDGDLLWVAIERGKVLGVATTRLLDDGRAELKHVAGCQAARWRGKLEAQICEWARGHKCPAIVSRGRVGWWPIVREMGWQMVGNDDGLTLFEKDLT